MDDHVVKLSVDGPQTFGDLYVSGFSSEKTAKSVGDAFASVLGQKYEADVVVNLTHSFSRDPQHSLFKVCQCGKWEDHSVHKETE